MGVWCWSCGVGGGRRGGRGGGTERGRRAALKQRKGWKAMAEDSPADRAAGQLSRQRASLLDAALRHVPFDGWTWTALDAGARDLSLAPGEEIGRAHV